MLTRPRRAAICTLLSCALCASVALSQPAQFLAPRLSSETAQFGAIEIDEQRAQGWSDVIDNVRLKKQLMALDGSLTYREGALGFYRVAFEVIGDRTQGAVRVSVTIVGLNGARTILASSESVQRWRDGVFLYTPPTSAPQNGEIVTDIPLPTPWGGDGFGIRLEPRTPQSVVPSEDVRAYPSPFAALVSNGKPFCAPDPAPKRERKHEPKPEREEKPKAERAPEPQPKPEREEKPKIERALEPQPRREEKPQQASEPKPQREEKPQQAPDPAPESRRETKPKIDNAPDPAPKPRRPHSPATEPQSTPDPAPKSGEKPQPVPTPKPRRTPNPAPQPQRAPNPIPPATSRPQSAPDPDPLVNRAPRPAPRPQHAPDPNPPVKTRPNFEPPRRKPQPAPEPNPNPRPQSSAPNPVPNYGGTRPSFPDPNPPGSRVVRAPDPRPDLRPNLDGRYPGYARPSYRPRTNYWDYRYDSYLNHHWNPNYSYTYAPQIYYYSQNYYGTPYAQARDSFTRSRDYGVSQAFEFALIEARSRAQADLDRQLRGEQ